MESCRNQRFWYILYSCYCHPLIRWQLCTLLVFFQPASPEMIFRQSWRSSHICWALVGCFSFTLRSNSSQTISSGWLLRPGHLMQHSITLLLGQIALTQPGCVLGHSPVEKQIILPLSANQMGWCIAAEFCGSHAGCVPWILNKSQTLSPAKHPYTITLPPSCFTVGSTQG
jgi:hypothetical protein